MTEDMFVACVEDCALDILLVYQAGYNLIVNNIYSPSRCYTVLQLI